MTNPSDAEAPVFLTVPGLHNSGAGHWQTHWEAEREGFTRIQLGSWSLPHRNTWVSRIEQTVRGIARPVVLVAHSLGCHAVAHWAKLAVTSGDQPLVAGALLVAPPEVDYSGIVPALRDFSPSPTAPFWFPTILVASQNDPYIDVRRARDLAQRWGSRFVDVGERGHINAESNLGSWYEGQRFLDELLGRSTTPASQRNASAGPPPRYVGH